MHIHMQCMHYCTKEALIGEHNQRPLLTFYKGAVLGNNQAITQVHSYDIFVIPQIRVITKISYSSFWVITITYTP